MGRNEKRAGCQCVSTWIHRCHVKPILAYRTYRRLIKWLPYFYKLIELGMSNYEIRNVLKWNYRTVRKYGAVKMENVIDRKTLNTRIYGKSDAKI